MRTLAFCSSKPGCYPSTDGRQTGLLFQDIHEDALDPFQTQTRVSKDLFFQETIEEKDFEGYVSAIVGMCSLQRFSLPRNSESLSGRRHRPDVCQEHHML